ncbi:MAG: hypothetical protein OXH96_01270 [Spirochaetaceae bacterium]|nr:hypothetical protein [Spirochaetaceae bacterium]
MTIDGGYAHVSLSADSDDNPILATAIAGDADLIASGHRDDMLGGRERGWHPDHHGA